MGELARQLTADMERAAIRALTELGEKVKAETIRDLGDTPIRDPDANFNLQDETFVRVNPHYVEIVVPGPYAAKLHELMTIKRPSGSVPHFLSRNALAAAAEMPGVIAGEVRSTFAGRVQRDRVRVVR